VLNSEIKRVVNAFKYLCSHCVLKRFGLFVNIGFVFVKVRPKIKSSFIIYLAS